MNPIRKKEIYAPDDIAQITGMSPKVVQTWLEKADLPSFKVPGNHLRVRFDDLGKFLEKKGFARPLSWKGETEKFRVLLVDDEIDLLEIIQEILKEDPKLDVETESTGFGAALRIANWRPDVILLDFVMPGMDGFEVCKKLKADPLTKDIPIIATTSLSSAKNRDAVLQSGISYFLGKPFQGDMLLKVVRELLGISSE